LTRPVHHGEWPVSRARGSARSGALRKLPEKRLERRLEQNKAVSLTSCVPWQLDERTKGGPICNFRDLDRIAEIAQRESCQFGCEALNEERRKPKILILAHINRIEHMTSLGIRSHTARQSYPFAVSVIERLRFGVGCGSDWISFRRRSSMTC
jgi:hypothetical protein